MKAHKNVVRNSASHATNNSTPVRRMGVNDGLYWSFLSLPLIVLIGYFGGPAWTVTMVYATVWAIYAISFDLFSGYSGRLNMGFAMFPGIAGYASGTISASFDVSPWLSMPFGIAVSGFLALVLGMVTLRIKGIYFALASSIVPLVLIQIVFLFNQVFHGEDGIGGIRPLYFDNFHSLLGAVGLLAVVLGTSTWVVRGKLGLVLRAIKGGDLTAQALGINSFRILLMVFVLSAALGGAGGVYLAHFQMFVGPETLFVVATLQVITFAQIGGTGSIVGPLFASLVLVAFNEFLREWSEVRNFVYFAILVLLLRFAPDGIFVPLIKNFRRKF